MNDSFLTSLFKTLWYSCTEEWSFRKTKTRWGCGCWGGTKEGSLEGSQEDVEEGKKEVGERMVGRDSGRVWNWDF